MGRPARLWPVPVSLLRLGGGVAIVLVVLAGLPLLWWQGGMAATVLAALAGPGGWWPWVGWLDDQGHVSARWRLLAHFAAAIWGLVWLRWGQVLT